MLHDIVNRFLGNQKEVPPDFRAEERVLCGVRPTKLQNDVVSGKGVSSETADASDQIAQVFVPRIHDPDHVTYRSHHLTGDGGNFREGPCRGRMSFSQRRAGNLAEDGDLGKARADVIVKIRGYAGTHSLQLYDLSYTNTVCAVRYHSSRHRPSRQKPPLRPKRLHHGELECRRARTRHAIGVDGPHEETIRARSESGEVDASL